MDPLRKQRQFRRLAWGVVLVMLLPVAMAGQRGAVTSRATLGELVAGAETIVRGHVLGARVERHSILRNLSTVVVTVRVARVLKGKAGETYTFRQFIWDVRDRHDAAGYRKGQELLLLMNPVSRYGLTSPVGLEHGRFRILHDSQGQAAALNGRGNQQLFDAVPAEAARRGVSFSRRASALINSHRRGPVPLEDLEEIIVTLARKQ